MTFAIYFMALSQTQLEEPQTSTLGWLVIAAAWTLIAALRLAPFLPFWGGLQSKAVSKPALEAGERRRSRMTARGRHTNLFPQIKCRRADFEE